MTGGGGRTGDGRRWWEVGGGEMGGGGRAGDERRWDEGRWGKEDDGTLKVRDGKQGTKEQWAEGKEIEQNSILN